MASPFEKWSEINSVTKQYTNLNKQQSLLYFENLEDKIDSKNFWSKFKSYFCNEYNSGDTKILLIKNHEIINGNTDVANVFSSCLESVTECLDLFNWASKLYSQAKDSVENII